MYVFHGYTFMLGPIFNHHDFLVKGNEIAKGSGATKSAARNEAARQALEILPPITQRTKITRVRYQWFNKISLLIHIESDFCALIMLHSVSEGKIDKRGNKVDSTWSLPGHYLYLNQLAYLHIANPQTITKRMADARLRRLNKEIAGAFVNRDVATAGELMYCCRLQER